MQKALLSQVWLFTIFSSTTTLLGQNNLPVIVATQHHTYTELEEEDMHACCKGFCGKDLKVSSTLSSNSFNYNSTNLTDDDKNTAWVEGNENNGIGEYIEFEYTYDMQYIDAAEGACKYKDEFFIVNGYQKNEITWSNNNRVKKMKLYVNNTLFCYIILLDQMGTQSIKLNFIKLLNKKKNTIKMKFEVAEVYKGEKYNDTAISELFW